MNKNFIKYYFNLFIDSIKKIDEKQIYNALKILKKIQKKKSRLFILGIGGSAGNASHATNDFRKLCNIDAICPTDNVSEVTARSNDEGFETIFENFLKVSQLSKDDCILIFSVGGGNLKKKISLNIINALKFVKKKKAKSISIIGRSDGYAFKNSGIVIKINTNDQKLITPLTESFQAIVWHLFVSHPLLKKNKTKW